MLSVVRYLVRVAAVLSVFGCDEGRRVILAPDNTGPVAIVMHAHLGRKSAESADVRVGGESVVLLEGTLSAGFKVLMRDSSGDVARVHPVEIRTISTLGQCGCFARRLIIFQGNSERDVERVDREAGVRLTDARLRLGRCVKEEQLEDCPGPHTGL